MTRHGIPLTEYLLPKHIDVGIQYFSEFGAVPELEEREAAVYTQIPWDRWVDIHWSERSSIVAHYRIHLMIEAHINNAQEQAMKQQQAASRSQNKRPR